MLQKSTWLHLRIPFSIFLLPIFVFAVFVSPQKELFSVALSFVIIHLLLYPASNGYNSYFDKDENSIGGLRVPPKVTKELYWTSLVFDLLAIVTALLINWIFAVMLFIYGLISKAYSHPSIRLKKMPLTGWLTAGLFQGYFTFIMVLTALNGFQSEFLYDFRYWLPAALSSLFLWGSYPMTQVYQHEEDSRRGDITLSIRLGILGTFHFTMLMFVIATAGFVYYFVHYHSLNTALAFLLILSPVLLYFLYWYSRVRKDNSLADFSHTMRLNLISSLCLNAFFIGGILIQIAYES